jgi:adenosylhomocysteinase
LHSRRPFFPKLKIKKRGELVLSEVLSESTIRDIELAPQGQLKIDWVQGHMPVLNQLRKDFERELPFKGKKVVVCLHLEAKTAYLAN